MLRQLVGAIIAVFAIGNSAASGEILATYPIFWAGGASNLFESIIHRTYLSDVFNNQEGEGTLFEDIVIYGGETRVDMIALGDDPEFPTYAELLTDGLDWWLYDWADFNVGGSTGRFDLESLRLDFADPDHNGVDLHGYIVESVVRTITVDFDTPGGDPNGDGIWTDYEISGVFEIFGSPIPEPASLVLLAFGAGCVWRRRRRRH